MTVYGVRIQERGQVTIPSSIRKKLKLRKGDIVLFTETDAGVIIKPAALVTDEEKKAELQSIIHSLRERFQDYSADEIQDLVTEAINATRKRKI